MLVSLCKVRGRTDITDTSELIRGSQKDPLPDMVGQLCRTDGHTDVERTDGPADKSRTLGVDGEDRCPIIYFMYHMYEIDCMLELIDVVNIDLPDVTLDVVLYY